MTLYRDDMVSRISTECNQPKYIVKNIIKDYTDYIYKETEKGNSVKFLQLFYLDNKSQNNRATLAYICTEISKEKDYNNGIVKDVLETWEDCILQSLSEGGSISIYGVAKLYTEPALRIRKSGRLANTGYRVRATKWFRQRVRDIYDWQDA